MKADLVTVIGFDLSQKGYTVTRKVHYSKSIMIGITECHICSLLCIKTSGAVSSRCNFCDEVEDVKLYAK
jgi:hypothetical protein